MRRKGLRGLAVIVLFALVGCTSTIEFWKDDTNRMLTAWRRDLNEIHKSIDYHFFNYDWDDPYL